MRKMLGRVLRRWTWAAAAAALIPACGTGSSGGVGGGGPPSPGGPSYPATVPLPFASVTTGLAPLAVFFNAALGFTNTGSTPIVQPSDSDYGSFDYQWDFGDGGSGTWPTDSKSRNTDTGFVAAHVYETPGVYTAKVTITDAAGATHVYQEDITVTAFAGSTFYIASGGLDTNDGLTPGTAWQTPDRAFFSGLMGPNTRFLFNRGDTFSMVGPNLITVNGPGIIGAYGSGALPQISVTGVNGGIGVYKDDWRVMDLELIGPGATDKVGAVYLNATMQINRTLFLRLNCHDFRVPIGWGDFPAMYATPHDGNMVVECSVPNAGFTGMYLGGQRVAVLGTTVQNIGLEHCLRVFQAHRGVISHNVFNHPGLNRHSIKLHGPEPTDGRPDTKFVMLSDNSLIGTVQTVAIGPQNGLKDERLTHIVFERNRFTAVSTTLSDLQVWARHVTIRNNLFDGTGSSTEYEGIEVVQRGIEPPPLDVKIFNNTMFKSDTFTRFNGVNVHPECSQMVVKNNLGCAVASPGGVIVFGLAIVDPSNSMTVPTDFVSPGTGDFHLNAATSGVDTGLPVIHARTDFDGVARPQGAGTDRGAYER